MVFACPLEQLDDVADPVVRARVELERKTPDEFLLELTVLAHGRKRELPGIPPSAR